MHLLASTSGDPGRVYRETRVSSSKIMLIK